VFHLHLRLLLIDNNRKNKVKRYRHNAFLELSRAPEYRWE
jgi:hypothetical protein